MTMLEMRSAKPEAITRSMPHDGAARRWAAIVERDGSADGQFVYAVTTTGVFCRPSCPSRRPLREHVELFEDGEAATRAGYRACKRCRPTEADPRGDLDRLLTRACRLLETPDGAARSDEVAAEVGLSAHYFSRSFKKRMGVTPQEYRRRALSERAKLELSGAGSVTEAVYAAGYSSSSRFYEGAARELGMPARAAREGATGRAVHFAVRACSLGQLLVAWTERGVCDVRFGDSEASVTEALEKRLPGATLARGDVPSWVDDVLGLVERPRDASIPLDVQGTAFQERVWQALRLIPRGETRSYADVARAIGAPEAVRAVARACATNPTAVVVPCHRVVRKDGETSGYRWGAGRKTELLRRERRTR